MVTKLAIIALMGLAATGCQVSLGPQGSTGAGGASSATGVGSTGTGTAMPGCYQLAGTQLSSGKGEIHTDSSYKCDALADGGTRCTNTLDNKIYSLWPDQNRDEINTTGATDGGLKYRDRNTWTALPKVICPGDTLSWELDAEHVSGDEPPPGSYGYGLYSDPSFGAMSGGDGKSGLTWGGTNHPDTLAPGKVTVSLKVDVAYLTKPPDEWWLSTSFPSKVSVGYHYLRVK